MNVTKHLKSLIRRKNFLYNRVKNSTDDLSFDKAEVAALTWAIQELSKIYPESAQRTGENKESLIV
jgi:hypothetical protein